MTAQAQAIPLSKTQQLISAIEGNLRQGILYCRIAKRIHTAFEEQRLSPGNWYDAGVFRACRDGAIMAMNRITDPAMSGHCETSLLNSLFEHTLKFPSEYGDLPLSTISDTVAEHKATVSAENVSKRAKTLRDKSLAHSDFSKIVDPLELSASYVSIAEVEKLLTELHEIVNEYIRYFRFPATGLDEETSLPNTEFTLLGVTVFNGMLASVDSEIEALISFREDQKLKWLAQLGPTHSFNLKPQGDQGKQA